MYLLGFFEKYSNIICAIYFICSILSYKYLSDNQDGRVALLWIVFIILAIVHLSEKFAKKHFRWYKNLYINVGISSSIALSLYLIFINPLQAFVIRTSSMQPTIYPKNLVIVNKLAYRSKQPQRRDVALIKINIGTTPMVHRILACQNDVVKIKGGKVTVNDEKIEFDTLDTLETEIIIVPNGAYYHKGDNPNSYHGLIYRDQILGKIIYISGGRL